MRKIYPPPFNKFIVIIFYGLLSIAVIVTAQSDCTANPIENAANKIIIGYVQPNIDVKTIRWDYYDYINLIVSDVSFETSYTTQINSLIDARSGYNASKTTKILLSIRNYDLNSWGYETNFYDDLSNNASNLISNFNLDGIDIEYPGMRGNLCSNLQNPPKNRDATFAAFIRSMRNRNQNKTISITVGSGQNSQILGLNNVIDFLNIETYHYSLYQNLRNSNSNSLNSPTSYPILTSYPNSPFHEFKNARDSWNAFDSEKIIMGLDFGNTIQVIPNAFIKNIPSGVFPNSYYDIKYNVTPINSICPGTQPTLYSFPWKNLLNASLDLSKDPNNFCNTNTNWTRKFDYMYNTYNPYNANNQNSQSLVDYTPWLYSVYPILQDTYFFVSYEDPVSLSYKLNNLKMKGMSISDVSYDDDNSTLLKFIRGESLDISSSNNNNTVGLNPPSFPEDKHKTGVIVGAVIGGLAGLIILGASFFYWRRSKLKYMNTKGPNANAITKNNIRSHTTTKNTETSSEPRLNAPTTVIPVASGYVTAMFDFEGKEENDLSFKKGDKIEVLERGDGPNDWWVGRVNGHVGEFPGNYVKETN